jgi:hypothetical protein
LLSPWWPAPRGRRLLDSDKQPMPDCGDPTMRLRDRADPPRDDYMRSEKHEITRQVALYFF